MSWKVFLMLHVLILIDYIICEIYPYITLNFNCQYPLQDHKPKYSEFCLRLHVEARGSPNTLKTGSINLRLNLINGFFVKPKRRHKYGKPSSGFETNVSLT